MLNQMGAHPASGAAVQVLAGRYGPYVTDGKTNASLPKTADPAKLTMEEAVALLKAREDAGPKKPVARRGRHAHRVGRPARKEGGRRPSAAPGRAKGPVLRTLSK